MTIRTYQTSDSLAAITELLHLAYKPLADVGLNFVASHQDETTTKIRIEKGTCLIAELDGVIVGTITYYPVANTKGTEFMDRADVASFGQFAVRPDLQGTGLGSQLLDQVESIAMSERVSELCLNTAEPATELREYYTRRGYRFVGFVQWPELFYRSVVLSKLLKHSDETTK